MLCRRVSLLCGRSAIDYLNSSSQDEKPVLSVKISGHIACHETQTQHKGPWRIISNTNEIDIQYNTWKQY